MRWWLSPRGKSSSSRSVGDSLDDAVGRSLLLSRLQDLLGWLHANADDLATEVRGTEAGFEQVDVFELLQELRGQVESFFPRLRVNLAATSATTEPTQTTTNSGCRS